MNTRRRQNALDVRGEITSGNLDPFLGRIGRPPDPISAEPQVRQRDGQRAAILDLARRHAEAHDIAALDEHRPGRVENGPARHEQRRALHLLALGFRGPLPPLPELHLCRLPDQRDHEGDQRRLEHPDATNAAH